MSIQITKHTICRPGQDLRNVQCPLHLFCVPMEAMCWKWKWHKLISLLLTHGLFLLARDGVSNSISQVFIYYFPFQSWGNFLLLPPSTSTLRKKKRYEFCNFHLWQRSLSYCSLITKYWCRFL